MSDFVKKRLNKKRRVLIVDDEEINRLLLQNILAQDYDVMLASNGEEALEIIHKMTGEKLPHKEAGTLCLHFIADQLNPKEKKQLDTAMICEQCTKIIEDNFSIHIDRDSFNYSRFITHLDYLIRRLSEGQLIESENQTIFEELKKSYPDSYACSLKIADYLNRELHKQINDEEILYLVIHINRLISRIEE